MTVEVHPIGMACNLGCTYCYENPMRDAGNITHPTNVEAMKASLLKEGADFAVFGGEPLLTPMPILEELFAFGYKHWKKNGIQTNGVLITDAHIEMFKKYNVQVGISVDGPGAMNNARVANNGRTEEATKASMENTEKLFNAGIRPSFIVTLHNLNIGTDDLTDQFIGWLQYWDDRGMRHITLHLLEPDGDVADLIPSTEQLVKAFRKIRSIRFKVLRFDIFEHMKQLLAGDPDKATCVWHACDPYTTSAVRGVDSDGTRTNCGRTNKDGVAWRKAEKTGFERQIALYNTPHEHGGCQGCRFFVVCKGYCPGTSIDHDWRNRTVHCEAITALLEYEESLLIAQGITPVSVGEKRVAAEKRMFDVLSDPRAMGHGDIHHDMQHGDGHGDAPHVDVPHGDSNKVHLPVRSTIFRGVLGDVHVDGHVDMCDEEADKHSIRSKVLSCNCKGKCGGHRA